MDSNHSFSLTDLCYTTHPRSSAKALTPFKIGACCLSSIDFMSEKYISEVSEVLFLLNSRRMIHFILLLITPPSGHSSKSEGPSHFLFVQVIFLYSLSLRPTFSLLTFLKASDLTAVYTSTLCSE
jgi:hypothetical protein